MSQSLQQVLDVIVSQQRERNGGCAGEGLIASCRQFADQRPVRPSTDEDEVAGCIGARIDGIPCRLEREEQLLSFLGRDGMLDLIDDQHDVGFGLVDHLAQCLS
ncbi:hypothetical protein D3C78_1523020 [compost metagenome]